MSLSVCMIVKDGEEAFGKALDSVKGLADEIVVVVDKGCSGKTKGIATERGASVHEFTWCDDFSAARNESLKHVTKDWILVLDADEELPKKHHDDVRKLMEAKDAAGYKLLQINFTDDSSLEGWKPVQDAGEGKPKGFFATRVVRLFRNDERYRFEGIVHELVEPSIRRAGGKVLPADVPIYNFGYVGKVDLRRKRERSLEMSTRKAKESGSAQAFFEKGVLEKQLGRPDEALASFSEAVKKDPKHHLAQFELGLSLEKRQEFGKAFKAYEESVLAQATSAAFVGMARCQIKQGKLKEAFRDLKKASLVNANNPSIYFNMGVVQDLSRNFKDAVKMYELAVKLNPRYASAYLNLGNTLVNLRQYDAALKAYERAASSGHKRKGEIEERIREMKEKLKDAVKVSYSVILGGGEAGKGQDTGDGKAAGQAPSGKSAEDTSLKKD